MLSSVKKNIIIHSLIERSKQGLALETGHHSLLSCIVSSDINPLMS